VARIVTAEMASDPRIVRITTTGTTDARMSCGRYFAK